MDETRDPPYPADTRSAGWRFELDLTALEGSDTWGLASDELRPWLLLLWLRAWQSYPAGSLPTDDAAISARLRMPLQRFQEHRAVLMRGWWLASDGRLYHPTITLRVLEMLQRRDGWRERKGRQRTMSRVIPRDSTGSPAGVTPCPSSTSTSTSTSNKTTTREAEGCSAVLFSSGGGEREQPIGALRAPHPRSPEPERGKEQHADEIRAVFAHYRKYHPRSNPAPRSTQKEWQRIAARLREGFTLEDLCTAIDGCHKDPWHLGENDRAKPFLKLELIVRDSDHVNQFLEIAGRPVAPAMSERGLKSYRAVANFLERRRGSNGSH